MDKKLSTLVDRLQAALGDRLLSVILYGSAVDGGQDRYSDLNVLCVLTAVTARELNEVEPVFKWWRAERCPAPLLFSEEELRASQDCFTIEYRDIQERHRVLYGKDLASTLEIDYTYYRAHIERELREKLLRLRQKATATMRQPELLTRLMLDSISSFIALMRHSLLLAGEATAPVGKREIVSAAAARFGVPAAPFVSLLDLREDKGRPGEPPAELFAQYLNAVDHLVRAVDRL